MDYCISVSSWRSSDETQYDITFLFKYMYIYMMKPDSVLQMIRLNQPHIVVGMNWTATEFIFYKLSVTTSNCFRNWAKVPQFVSLNLTQPNAAKKKRKIKRWL